MSIQVSPTVTNGSQAHVSGGDNYLLELLQQCQKGVETLHVTSLQEIRDRAASIIRQSTLPTTKVEEWRFTDLSALKQIKFSVETFHETSLQIDIAPLTFPEAANSRLVFVNGIYASELSAIGDLPKGVVASNLSGLPAEYRDRLNNYLAKSEEREEIFTALNTAGMIDVAVVWIPKNVLVETPIHLLFIANSFRTPTIQQPRCLVVAETGSSVTLVEDYLNQFNIEDPEEGEAEVGETVYLTNAVTEIWLGENAQVRHTRVERESVEAFHIGKTAITQARDSRYTCNTITLGAKLSRHNLDIYQTGEQTETILNGLTMIAGQQTADTHSAIALNYPYGMSRQLHKCIVADKAHTVFNGRVFVAKAAQLTDAGQLNRNLLLSPKARVDTKPQLEIIADNVKCSHGATVSQLEDDEIFYLQSRGINAADAQNLLVNAFAAEILNQLPIPSLQQTLLKAVMLSHKS
ncbi:Fe-S cluster assembly protein SufD [cyanobacterium TDX16]|nr:Fe-S cluster assembly protein SufD [cyanobacterium TDX16]